MYDTEKRYCPKHPTLVHPCQICGNPTSKVAASAPDNTVVDGVNWQTESQTPYNTPEPIGYKYVPHEQLSRDLGLDRYLDDPADRVPPRPLPPVSSGQPMVTPFDSTG